MYTTYEPRFGPVTSWITHWILLLEAICASMCYCLQNYSADPNTVVGFLQQQKEVTMYI